MKAIVAYNNVEKTVALLARHPEQVHRGIIHAHGNTTLLQLTNYDFSKEKTGYVYEEKIGDAIRETSGWHGRINYMEGL